MPAVLIDTNVLVYVFEQRDPSRQDQAGRVLRYLESTSQGWLSAQCLAEFYNVVTRSLNPLLSRADAFVHLQRWMRAFPVIPLTEMIVLEAARGARDYRLAYYDAQIWAAARLHQIPIIFSEDFQDGLTLEGVRFIDPFAPQFDLDHWIVGNPSSSVKRRPINPRKKSD